MAYDFLKHLWYPPNFFKFCNPILYELNNVTKVAARNERIKERERELEYFQLNSGMKARYILKRGATHIGPKQ